jgi:leucine dehydrogenase
MLISRQLDTSNNPHYDSHEQVKVFEDSELGLSAIIAVHNTNLGPSLGGCRIYPYDHFDDAVTDVLRLSRGMTYKSALAGLPLGGGKAVIIGNPKTIKSHAFMARFGEAVAQMNGTYITAEDVGSSEEDMLAIASATSYVAGLPPEDESSNNVSGNPSPVTAYGVYCGLKACAERVYSSSNLKGKKVAIQGMGAVGYALARYLFADGALLTVADINSATIEKAKEEFGQSLTIADVATVHTAEVDIFSPCALGASLNDVTIPKIRAKIIGGAANNQLAAPQHDKMLNDMGILYAPDYAINSGGITSVGYEYFSRTGRNPYDYPLTRERMNAHVEKISDTLQMIFSIADEQKIGTGLAADILAEKIFKVGRTQSSTSAA